MPFEEHDRRRLHHIESLVTKLVGDDLDNPLVLLILQELVTTMSALTDSVTAMQSAVSANTDATNAAVAKITGITQPSDAAEVAAATQAITDATTAISANTDALNAAQPTPAP